MAVTVVPNRFHNGYVFSSAGSITPAIDDKIALFDASNSDAKSYATIRQLLWEIAKTQHRYQFHFLTDFSQESSTSPTDNSLSEINSTGSTSNVANDDQARIGIAQLTTAGSATGRTFIGGASTSIIRFGGASYFFETALKVATLSTSGERFQLVAGFMDTATAAAQTDAACFYYDEGGIATGTAAAYWQTCTAANTTRTFNTSLTQTTVNAATWYRLGIEVNADASSVGFYIDGTLVGTHTANIPSASGFALSFGVLLIKSVGTTARTVDCDYQVCNADFTTAR